MASNTIDNENGIELTSVINNNNNNNNNNNLLKLGSYRVAVVILHVNKT